MRAQTFLRSSRSGSPRAEVREMVLVVPEDPGRVAEIRPGVEDVLVPEHVELMIRRQRPVLVLAAQEQPALVLRLRPVAPLGRPPRPVVTRPQVLLQRGEVDRLDVCPGLCQVHDALARHHLREPVRLRPVRRLQPAAQPHLTVFAHHETHLLTRSLTPPPYRRLTPTALGSRKRSPPSNAACPEVGTATGESGRHPDDGRGTVSISLQGSPFPRAGPSVRRGSRSRLRGGRRSGRRSG